jgi:hypothetical protein
MDDIIIKESSHINCKTLYTDTFPEFDSERRYQGVYYFIIEQTDQDLLVGYIPHTYAEGIDIDDSKDDWEAVHTEVYRQHMIPFIQSSREEFIEEYTKKLTNSEFRMPREFGTFITRKYIEFTNIDISIYFNTNLAATVAATVAANIIERAGFQYNTSLIKSTLKL